MAAHDGEKKREVALTAAVSVVRRLADSGHSALFAGGWVRDRILGIPSSDIDIATSADPREVMALFEKTVPIGVDYGVVLVIEEGLPFEVATFRRDRGCSDGRHPVSVEYSSPEEDARRRDFTINGLFYDPIRDRILDYVGGQEDIRGKLVRTIGSPVERFREDYLRLIRGVRFAARLGFEIEAGTRRALEQEADKLRHVSAERVRDEVGRILTRKGAGRGMQLLEETGLMRVILPEISAMRGVPQPEQFHPEGDVFEHTRVMLDLLEAPSAVLAFATLLHDVGKPGTYRVAERIRFDNHDCVGAQIATEICRRLRLSNREREDVVACVGNHMRMAHVRVMREAKLKRLLARGTIMDELELHRVDCLASHRDLSNWEFCMSKLKEYGEEEIRPRPLVTGHDLIEAGYRPGPSFKQMLAAVEEAQLEGEIRTREDGLGLVKRLFPQADSGQGT